MPRDYSATVADVDLHPLRDEGGSGGPILVLHGLMGSARTWDRHLPWLRTLGHVFTFDAAGHGRPAPTELTTEAFVDDLANHLDAARARGWFSEPLNVIGHSMGALHGWVLASSRPDLVRALVVEDIAPDFRGRTAANWAAMIKAWPQPFPSADAMREFFGPVAGQYFLESFERRDDGWYLHGDVDTFRDISEEWGTRDFWQQWRDVAVPALLIEGEHTITPPGQMARMAEIGHDTTYLRVADAGHLIHDEQPQQYRDAVEQFLSRV
ncbi:MAG: alpha/beta hydrolase [Rhodococcus sp.]|nr:alpha/beta hydrolase [Rhodococcus sp. (in: high G+C Gram-positive bacteria)]